MALILNLSWVSASHAHEAAAINKAASECLNFVHSFPAEEPYASAFKRFDAYYNSATGAVENNASSFPISDFRGVANQAALFQFNKCMAQHGIPLEYKKSN